MKQALVRLATIAALAFGLPGAALAQIQTIDPDNGAAWQPYDAPAAETPAAATPADDAQESLPPEPQSPPPSEWSPINTPSATPAISSAPQPGATQAPPARPEGLVEQTAAVPRQDIFQAAEHVFGQGAEGLAKILEDILSDQGEPIAYIAGREAGGALVLGVRYGSGMMRHRIEGDREVYWTGPSIGFDVGADASKVFVLVYNLHDAEQIFRRYPGAEGRAYLGGGFTATYLRRGDVVLIPVRLGVGLRLGINAGYMRFSEKNRWSPF